MVECVLMMKQILGLQETLLLSSFTDAQNKPGHGCLGSLASILAACQLAVLSGFGWNPSARAGREQTRETKVGHLFSLMALKLLLRDWLHRRPSARDGCCRTWLSKQRFSCACSRLLIRYVALALRTKTSVSAPEHLQMVATSPSHCLVRLYCLSMKRNMRSPSQTSVQTHPIGPFRNAILVKAE